MSYKLTIRRDDDPVSPREWDNVGTIVSAHRRYNLADSGAPSIDRHDFDSWEDVDRYLRDECGAVAVLPVYLYDHGAWAISAEPFSCPWDSGRVGAIYATADSVEEILGASATDDDVRRVLRDEISTYDQYIRGDIWCFVVEDRWGNVIESCGGFYGEEDATNEGEAALRYLIEHEPKPCAQKAPACS